jgi:hypothetical protein
MPREGIALPLLESPASPTREAELAADGWERRFAVLPPRLEEMSDLYRALGYEVRLEPVERGELPAECGDCPAAMVLARVIYIRRLQ